MQLIARCILMLVFISTTTQAQNLVPNPSFELLNNCPTGYSAVVYSPGYSSFPYVQDWVSPLASTTPDIFNTCVTSSFHVHVPLSAMGYQWPHSGDGYAGILLKVESKTNINTFIYREYLETRLLQPLVAGRDYCVSFYINITASNFDNKDWHAIDKVGAHFSNTQINSSQNELLLPMHIGNAAGNYLTDTNSWVQISGVYTATGGEQWMTLGYFDTGHLAFMPLILPSDTPVNFRRAYAFFDDVSVDTVLQPIQVSTFDTIMCEADIPGHVLYAANMQAQGYKWNNGSPENSLVIQDTGTYWCWYYKNCQRYVDTFKIKIKPVDTISTLHDTTICPGSILLQPVYSGVGHQWNTGATSAQIAVTTEGIYWCTYTIGCDIYTDTFKIAHIEEMPDPELGPDKAICASDSVLLQSTNNYSAYVWSTNEVDPSITVFLPGIYTLTVYDKCGNSKSDAITLYNIPAPIANDTTVCLGAEHVMLHAEGANILWYNDVHGDGSVLQPLVNTSVVGTQTLYVSQTAGGCESEKRALAISVITPATVDLGRDSIFCGQLYMLGTPEQSGVSYAWNTGQTSNYIMPLNEGTYMLYASNDCGAASDTVEIEIDCKKCVSVPTAFSPNGDGINDVFLPRIQCPIKEYSFTIFNRWGQVVFKTTDTTVGWNGLVSEVNGEMESYGVLIQYTPDVHGAGREVIQGNVTLTR